MYNISHMKQTRATSRHSSIRRFEELKSLSLRIKQTTTADKIRPDWQKQISSCELMSTIWTLSTAVYLNRVRLVFCGLLFFVETTACATSTLRQSNMKTRSTIQGSVSARSTYLCSMTFIQNLLFLLFKKRRVYK